MVIFVKEKLRIHSAVGDVYIFDSGWWGNIDGRSTVSFSSEEKMGVNGKGPFGVFMV